MSTNILCARLSWIFSRFKVNCSQFERGKSCGNILPIRGFKISIVMAHSKYEYVRTFESEEIMLPNCWTVARIDGRGFHKLAETHNWKRPNDDRGLNLMTKAAKTVMAEFQEIILAYGQSDEYSFVFRRNANIFERRKTKVITTLVSKFASAYVYNWSQYFKDVELVYPPSFDGRIVMYPTDENLRDYLSWRQADCHINNLYNTTFWALVQQGGMTNTDAQKKLSGTLSGDKNEILFSRFNVNYNNEPQLYRKGTVLVQPYKDPQVRISKRRQKQERKQQKSPNENDLNSSSSEGPHFNLKEFQEKLISAAAIEFNRDIIGPSFWSEFPYLLDPEAAVPPDVCKKLQEMSKKKEDNLVTV